MLIAALQCIAFLILVFILGTMANRVRVVGYTRVSTDRQAEKGVSLEAQYAKLVAYCSLFDYELVGVIEDAGQSAATLERDGLTRALGMLKKGQADALLVVKLDRLTRSVRDLGKLLDMGFRKGKYRLLSVSEQLDTGSAAGRMVTSMLAVVSEWEREAIGERTSAAMQHMRSEGAFTGGRAPYGFALTESGELSPVATEQAVSALAGEMRASKRSLRQIAAELDRLGHRSRSGRAFSAEQVRRMIAATVTETRAA
jgi:DNA invertase Pin-like site-specific DNA recombinase